MLQQVETIFEDMAPMLKGLKKKTYEANMKTFREKNNEFFFNMMDQLKMGNKEAIAKHLSNSFVAISQWHFLNSPSLKNFLY